MTDVFISYAREDQQFVRTLFAALEERKREAWVDWEGIPPSAEWMAEIEAAIDAGDAFLFVMSQNSIASAICRKELEHAIGQNKRLVPVMRQEWEDQPIPEALARLNWIFLREGDDFAAGVDTLIEALDTDLAHVKLHTRYLQRAVDWERKGTGKSYALRGQDLIAAENWLAESGGKEPRPTSAQNRYVLESRRVTTLRQRVTAGAVSFGVLVATVLGLLGAQARAAGRQNQQRSIANQLVGESRLAREEQEDGLEESVQLAVEAMRRFDALGEHSLAADQELRRGLGLLPRKPELDTVGAPGAVRAEAFSPRGGHMAVATSLGHVRVWDTLERATIGSWTLQIEDGYDIRDIAVNDAGSHAAIWLHNSIDVTARPTLWDVARGIELASCDQDGYFGASTARLGPRGRLWIADGEAWRWDDCQKMALWDESFVVSAMTLGDDGVWLAASIRERGLRAPWIEIRDVETGTELARWRHEGSVRSLWLLDNGRLLAGLDLDSKRLQVWDTEPPHRLREFELAAPVIAISGDGRFVATQESNNLISKVWDLDTGEEVARLVHPSLVEAAVFGLNGDLLTLAGSIRRWSLKSGEEAVSLWPDVLSDLAAVDPGDRTHHDLAAGLDLGVAGGETLVAVVPCPADRRLAVTTGSTTRAGWRARTELWDLASGERLESFDLTETVGRGMRGIDDSAIGLLACSRDGKYLATPARDAVVVRELGIDGFFRLFHPGLRSLAFGPGGEYAATAGLGPVRIWQLSSRAEVGRLLDHGPVTNLIFAPDGRFLATAGERGINVFRWRPKDLIEQACERLEGNLGRDDWRNLFPDEPYVASCPDLDGGR
jgi:WD40 repeat protein